MPSGSMIFHVAGSYQDDSRAGADSLPLAKPPQPSGHRAATQAMLLIAQSLLLGLMVICFAVSPAPALQ
jgi:hypothetical protein